MGMISPIPQKVFGEIGFLSLSVRIMTIFGRRPC